MYSDNDTIVNENHVYHLDAAKEDTDSGTETALVKDVDSSYSSEDTIKYLKKLNEEYKEGFVDSESFTQTYDEYIAKLSTCCELGMVDQWRDFAYTLNDVFK